MESFMEFTIEPLLVRKNGKITGPSAPVLFADDMLVRSPYEYNRLAKVTFADIRILQRMEEDGLTSFCHYLIGYQYDNDLWLSLWVDEGIAGISVAMCFESSREVRLSAGYKGSSYILKPDRTDLLTLFNHVFANPQLIAIKEI